LLHRVNEKKFRRGGGVKRPDSNCPSSPNYTRGNVGGEEDFQSSIPATGSIEAKRRGMTQERAGHPTNRLKVKTTPRCVKKKYKIKQTNRGNRLCGRARLEDVVDLS